MKHRLLALVAAAAVLLTLAVVPVAAEGSCLIPNTSRDKIFVIKYYTDVADRFDYVDGTATARDLDECTGNGNSAILPANLQTAGGAIYQLGYMDGPRCIFYVYRNGVPVCTGATQVIGRSYTFSISMADLPSGDMKVHYKVTDISASPDVVVFEKYITQSDTSKGTIDWWGAERQETQSSLGNCHGCSPIDMRFMHYSVDGDGGQLTTRDGLSSANKCADNNGCATGWAGKDFGYSSGLDLNVQHFHIKSTRYLSDTVTFDNTAP